MSCCWLPCFPDDGAEWPYWHQYIFKSTIFSIERRVLFPKTTQYHVSPSSPCLDCIFNPCSAPQNISASVGEMPMNWRVTDVNLTFMNLNSRLTPGESVSEWKSSGTRAAGAASVLWELSWSGWKGSWANCHLLWKVLPNLSDSLWRIYSHHSLLLSLRILLYLEQLDLPYLMQSHTPFPPWKNLQLKTHRHFFFSA